MPTRLLRDLAVNVMRGYTIHILKTNISNAYEHLSAQEDGISTFH